MNAEQVTVIIETGGRRVKAVRQIDSNALLVIAKKGRFQHELDTAVKDAIEVAEREDLL